MAANKIDPKNVKEVVKEVLKIVANISSAAGTINPIFSVAGSLIQVVLDQVDDEDLMKKLKCEFENINQSLNKISEQNQQTLLDIRKRAAANKYTNIETCLHNQFKSYLDMVNAEPEKIQSKKKAFIESYELNKDDMCGGDTTGLQRSCSKSVLGVFTG